MSVAPSVTACL